MRKFILSMVCVLSIIPLLQGAPMPLNTKLERPPYSEVCKDTQSPPAILHSLLEQGKLEEFYQHAQQFLTEYRDIQDKDSHQVQTELWTMYYIAAAPLYQIDKSPDALIPWRLDKTLDYDIKTYAARYIAIQNIEQLTTGLSVPKEQLTGLYSLYLAHILHCIRQSYEPDMEKEQQRWALEQSEINGKLFREGKLDFDQGRLRSLLVHNKICTEDLRNNCANMRVKSLEKTFLKVLVKYYPGNAAKVKKYIKLAGYSDKEIPDLIDRAIGRDPTTEFLYTGASGRDPAPPERLSRRKDISPF